MEPAAGALFTFGDSNQNFSPILTKTLVVSRRLGTGSYIFGCWGVESRSFAATLVALCLCLHYGCHTLTEPAAGASTPHAFVRP